MSINEIVAFILMVLVLIFFIPIGAIYIWGLIYIWIRYIKELIKDIKELR